MEQGGKILRTQNPTGLLDRGNPAITEKEVTHRELEFINYCELCWMKYHAGEEVPPGYTQMPGDSPQHPDFY